MRPDGEDDKKEDLVQSYLRDKAKQAASRLIQDVSQKAAQDVDSRLRRYQPSAEGIESKKAPDSTRCGRTEGSSEDLAAGVRRIYEKYYRRGMAALNRGDASTATFYLSKCLLLPVPDDLKMRQMIRHNLRLAMSLRERQKQE
jgi:hypothetical protein